MKKKAEKNLCGKNLGFLEIEKENGIMLCFDKKYVIYYPVDVLEES